MAVVSKGFTLLELLVTISIIGILLGIGSVSFSTAQKRGRDSRRKSDMKAIQMALEQCYILDNKYLGSISYGGALTCTSGDITMNQIPKDPKNNGDYIYADYTVDVPFPKTKYCLCAELEDTGMGNANTGGSAGVCSFTPGDFFCVSNLQ